MFKYFFYYLIFPGFLFSACIGLIAGWVDRKVSARLQWRVGPPWYQNFVDIIKLFAKETIVPVRGRLTFLVAPYIGLLGVSLADLILGLSFISGNASFLGDLIVVMYLLIIPALALIIGASSSSNPLASVGASREMKLVLGYELPFILSVVTVIIKSGGAIQFSEIISRQAIGGSFIFSPSGFIALGVAILCMQAKLGIAPFDIAEAEQEIMAGTLIEYSGIPLAIFKLTKACLLYTMPILLIILFIGNDLSPLFIALKFIAMLIIIILVKNTNPRLRIDQALRFFWGPATLLALVAVVLALFGQ